jgi:hypothetical protein
MAVQFCPLLVGNDLAVLDVQASAAEWTPDKAAAAVGKAATPDLQVAGQVGSVDRVPTLRQKIKTTVRVPLKKKIIVGGMTLDPSDGEQGGRQLYLVVEVEGGK